jgi:hypothetical protein
VKTDLVKNAVSLTRADFLRRSAQGLGALTLLSAIPNPSRAADAPVTPASTAPVFDLREFVHWIVSEFEPSVRLPGGAGHYTSKAGRTTIELYGVSDMACILHTIGALRPGEKERGDWAAAFQTLQDPKSGWLLEKTPTHSAQHNTAFALAAMELLDLVPTHPVTMGPEHADVRAFLGALNWKTAVYGESHKGAGLGSIYALVPALGTPAWFAEYFATCDALFDPRNGMMGIDKPAGGDFDQIGGTFHYAFLYQYFNRQMPFPEKRIDAVIGLQQPDGYWHPTNHLWLTLDAVYLLTRTLRQQPHRFDEVRAVVRRVMEIFQREVFSPEGRKKTILTGNLPVHSLTAAISLAAEAQQFLGAHEVVTEKPLRLVLDRRPFI